MDKLGVLRPLSLPPNVEGIEYGRQRGKVLGKEGEKKGRGGGGAENSIMVRLLIQLRHAAITIIPYPVT